MPLDRDALIWERNESAISATLLHVLNVGGLTRGTLELCQLRAMKGNRTRCGFSRS
jgi:hypothetical protein